MPVWIEETMALWHNIGYSWFSVKMVYYIESNRASYKVILAQRMSEVYSSEWSGGFGMGFGFENPGFVFL